MFTFARTIPVPEWLSLDLAAHEAVCEDVLEDDGGVRAVLLVGESLSGTTMRRRVPMTVLASRAAAVAFRGIQLRTNPVWPLQIPVCLVWIRRQQVA